ncbi:DsbE family thiol:disulfide interchange protein [Sulfitobacter sp. M57]|uniref:DsbE family thiol:disulfide interchange protein n=1 Tax=unclassified Sulfitobacter TaxID=196795 RepID=UPI0023E1F465|nr:MULTISPECIES: DsbE family thiol:disulfide interchange protein [unclassified Sulfitobacter]MDF3413345.1 DsbE family thiol:disulfide interchange protein [Sulfitobacter sp. KE5]MDF3421375.1 DsbE family thiol:disulfide interchange protein [Sulfitobacter sp. KE43]MDF3431892.1 DsbE family thiol:disulfide interchange protein [Sulfitobacter sp. KE42]MDF3457532.1 DsbE family thiol:disulfide interchange protein [Sulfitobacter sp. S74]MDF3461434.1 DsbE family thiol:disulfide interchange protein [Sulfi
MARFSPLMLVPPVVFAGFVALAAVGMYRDDPQGLPSTLIGQMAPLLPVETLSGFPKATQSMLATGEVTLVNFWASWCPPCRAEHPELLRLQAQGQSIIGVNFKDTGANATKYLIEDDNPFTGIGFDPTGRTAIDWGVTAPPETFILGKDGTVLFRFAGPLVGSDYEQRFVPALKAAMAE